MNLYLTLLATSAIIIMTSCDKPKVVSGSQVAPHHPKEFVIEHYRTMDGKEGISFTSESECELTTSGSTFAGKYEKKEGTIRIVVAIMGASQIVYCKYFDDGLSTDKGFKYFSADYIAIYRARAIAIACFEYSQSNQDNHPATLDLLIPKYLSDNSFFMSPFSPTSQEVAYDYFPGNIAGSPYRILLKSRYQNGNGKKLIVKYDSSVKFE